MTPDRHDIWMEVRGRLRAFIAKRQRHDLGRAARYQLSAGGDALRHRVRLHEARVGRVDERAERLGLGGKLRERGVIEVLARRGPRTPALLHEPEADDVFEQPHRAAKAGVNAQAYFGQAEFCARVIDNDAMFARQGKFQAHPETDP